jgi:hypothetical protein
MIDKRPNFHHRKNNPSSFDSICPRCFRTISTRRTEEELRQDEEAHLCDGNSLVRRSQVEPVHSS